MDLRLQGRVYVLTGASRGLGFAAAQALVDEGGRVVISGAHEDTAAAAATRLAHRGTAGGPERVAWLAAENAGEDAPARLIGAALERFGRLDGALVSVGGTVPGTVASTTDEQWREGFESVLLGGIRLGRAPRAALTARPGEGAATGAAGSLVFVLASSVRVPLEGLAFSNGMFPGLAGVVKMLAEELGPAGTRVNGILPARIATDRVRALDALRGDPDEVRARRSLEIPLRRYGEPEEFGRVAAFLLSPAASYVTGAMIPVDGGSVRVI